MKFQVWALKKMRKGEPCSVVTMDWGTPLRPLEVKIIEFWGNETTLAAYFSASGRVYEYRYKVKDGGYSDDLVSDYAEIECREVRRFERVTWEYEPVETAAPAVGNVI